MYMYIYIYIHMISATAPCARRRSWTFPCKGVWTSGLRRVIYLLYLPSSLSNFSLRDLKSARPQSPPPSPGHLLDLQDASKTPPRCLLFAIIFWMFFCIDFRSIFDANLAPTCLRKSMKIHEKPMPRAIPILHSFFIDF